LLRIVLSNCTIDAVNLDPTYKKPFDLIFQRVKNEGWLALLAWIIHDFAGGKRKGALKD